MGAISFSGLVIIDSIDKKSTESESDQPDEFVVRREEFRLPNLLPEERARVVWGMKPLNVEILYENKSSHLYLYQTAKCLETVSEAFPEWGSSPELLLVPEAIEHERVIQIQDSDTLTHSPYYRYNGDMGEPVSGVYQIILPAHYVPSWIKPIDTMRLVHAEVYEDERVVLTWVFDTEIGMLLVADEPADKKLSKLNFYDIPNAPKDKEPGSVREYMDKLKNNDIVQLIVKEITKNLLKF